MSDLDIRWEQRFENYDRAVNLLGEPFEKDVEALSDLAKQGIIKRFEIAFELSWKTLKDYMEFQGITLDQASPRYVIKEAFGAKIIPDASIWLDMLSFRNLLSHTYDVDVFEETLSRIEAGFLQELVDLRDFLMKEKSGK